LFSTEATSITGKERVKLTLDILNAYLKFIVYVAIRTYFFEPPSEFITTKHTFQDIWFISFTTSSAEGNPPSNFCYSFGS